MIFRHLKNFKNTSGLKLAGLLSVITLGNLALATSVEAAILNPGFENNLANWTPIGDVGIDKGAIGNDPLFGNSQAILTTGSGAASTGTVPTLETALGLTAGALDINPFLQAFEGSAVVQDVTVEAGETISFNWNFLTDDSNSTLPFTPGSPRDYGFVVLDGVVTLLADTSSSLTASTTSFDRETGFQSFNSAPLSEGTHTLGIGIVDIQDSSLDSALLIDAPQEVTTKSTPEPASNMGLLLLLSGTFGSWLKRKS